MNRFRRSMNVFRTALISAAVLVALGGEVSSAFAQPAGGGAGGGRRFGMMGGGMTDSQPISSQDLEKYAKIVNASAVQLDAMKLLHEGYVAQSGEHRAKVQAMVEKTRDEFRESRDPAIWQEMGEKMREMRDASAKIDVQFLDDIKSTLDDKQAVQWARVEKTRRRDQTLGRGLISGESVDVIRLVEQLKLNPEQEKAVAPALERYESELDPVLVKRNEVFEANMGRMQELMQQVMAGNPEEANKKLQEGRDVALRVRDVNRRFAREIESMLPAEVAPKFAEEFRKESFPRIYRQGRATQQMLDAAAKLEDLDATQRKSIEGIAESYTRDAAALNKKGEQAQEATEATMTVSTMMATFSGGGGGDPAMQEVRTARRELDRKTADAVKALLTEEQKAKLTPERAGQNAGGESGNMPPGDEGQPAPRRRQRNNDNAPAPVRPAGT